MTEETITTEVDRRINPSAVLVVRSSPLVDTYLGSNEQSDLSASCAHFLNNHGREMNRERARAVVLRAVT